LMYSCSSSVGGNSVRDGNNVRSDSMGGGNMGGGNMGGGNSVRDGRRTLVLVGFQLWDLR
jgi:hypothetical protein